MPREMATFEMPRPARAGPGQRHRRRTRRAGSLPAHFGAWLDAGGEPPALDLAGLAPDALRVLNETLGEGEVAAIVEADQRDPRSRRRVFSGVWREQHFDADGALLHDYLLAAPIPPVVDRAGARARRADACARSPCRPAR